MTRGNELEREKAELESERDLLQARVETLERALAYEARVVEAHYEGYKTFPKTRRAIAEEQVERMRQAVQGDASVAYAGVRFFDREHRALEGSGDEGKG